MVLIRANELYLAYHISKMFYPLALRETALLICEKLEKYFMGDLCLRILESEVSECKLQKRRLVNMGLLKAQGEEFSKYENIARNEDSPIKAIEYYLIAGNIEAACKKAVDILSLGNSP